MFTSVKLQISVYLFIYSFNLVKHFFQFYFDFTFEDVSHTLAVRIYMITCLLHAQHDFQQHNL